METKGDPVDRLKRTIASAKTIRESLQGVLDAHGDRVHFRPASSGISMVGLLHDYPQLGKSGLTKGDIQRLETDFESIFAEHCMTGPEKKTPEKQLQSFLIRESYRNGRHMRPINEASKDGVDLVFVTDEIALPTESGGKTVCDILALRRDGGRSRPVLIELKSERALKRLVAQVNDYSAMMNDHAPLFAELYSALLGEEIRFDLPPEKWIVWPMEGDTEDPRDAKQAEIRIVGYKPAAAGYDLRVERAKVE